MTRLLGALATLVALLVAGAAGAAPAGADPPRPTNDASTVTAVEPATDAVAAEVVGGDSFLHVVAQPGHEVVVLGYEGEPYLRFGPDGTVEVNRRSPASVLNESRFGDSGDLSRTDPTAEPEWARVATDGSYVWHDHRIHWMVAGEPPPTLDGASTGLIQTWDVDLLVDGAPVVVRGDLRREAAPSSLPWLAAALVVAAATVAVGWRSPRRAPAVVLAGASALALATSLVAELDLPAATGRRWSLVAIPAIGLACALWAALAPRSRFAVTLLVASAAVLTLWVGLRWGVLDHAVLPSATAAPLQRLAVAAGLGAVLGAAVLGARSVATSARAASAGPADARAAGPTPEPPAGPAPAAP